MGGDVGLAAFAPFGSEVLTFVFIAIDDDVGQREGGNQSRHDDGKADAPVQTIHCCSNYIAQRSKSAWRASHRCAAEVFGAEPFAGMLRIQQRNRIDGTHLRPMALKRGQLAQQDPRASRDRRRRTNHRIRPVLLDDRRDLDREPRPVRPPHVAIRMIKKQNGAKAEDAQLPGPHSPEIGIRHESWLADDTPLAVRGA
jgi:hypothetical protein